MSAELTDLNRSTYLASAARDFFDYTRALAYGEKKGTAGEALRFAQATRMSPRVQEMLQKAAVTPGSLTEWGSELAYIEAASRGFISLLPPFSAFDRLVSDRAVTPMPLHRRLVKAQSGVVASFIGEGKKKLLSSMSISVRVMPVLKVVAMIAYTSELQTMTTGLISDLFNNALRNSVALETDRKFLEEILGQGTGVATNASSGMDAASFLHDLSVALAAIKTALGVGSRLYLILPLAEFNTLSLLRDSGGPLIDSNGMIGNIRVIPTSADTSDAILLDATAIGADAGIVIPKTSAQADIEMDDNPTSGNREIISMWQTNRVAALIERYYGACVLRPEAIAVISGLDVTV